MTRITIIGNAGGGKSTLGRMLSHALGIELFSIDQVQWKPGWVRAPLEEIQQQHAEVLARERWIIDGWGPTETIRERFEAADTIVLVDLPLLIHYWWALKRQWMSIFRPRPDGPKGCPMLPMTWPLLKMIWTIHRYARPDLLALVDTYRDRKDVFHLRSRRELRRFIVAYGS